MSLQLGSPSGLPTRELLRGSIAMDQRVLLLEQRVQELERDRAGVPVDQAVRSQSLWATLEDLGRRLEAVEHLAGQAKAQAEGADDLAHLAYEFAEDIAADLADRGARR